MTKNDPNEFLEIKDLWQVYCSILAHKGVDLPALVNDWVRVKRDSLGRWDAITYFDELCDAGCGALPLAIVISVFVQFERGAEIWRSTTGKKKES
jgi:hypothetical protein